MGPIAWSAAGPRVCQMTPCRYTHFLVMPTFRNLRGVSFKGHWVSHFIENFWPEICGALDNVFLFGLPHMWQTISPGQLGRHHQGD